MGVFGRTLGWLKTAGASILRTPVEIAQRHQDVVCLMLEEDCSSSFLPSKMLGTNEAAVFIVTVVVMVLVKRWRRGGRFLEDQVCDEDGADEDAEDEQDAAAAAAQEAAEENERMVTLGEENSTLRSLNERLDGEVSTLRDQRKLAEDALALASHHSRDQQRDHAQKVQLLEGVNQEVLDRLDEEQRQRVVFEGAVEAQREGHRNQVAAIQRRLQAELASERQQHQENLNQAHELLATRNRDNEVLVEQAAAAERTVEEMRREREAAAIAATQLQEEQQMAAVRLSEQNQARLAAVHEELATSDDDKAVWSQRATVAERQVDEMKREREAAAIAATQLQEEQQMAAVRLSEQNQARLAAVREELATSDDEKAAWSQRATIAERQVEEMKREREAAAIAATQLQEEQQLAAVRLSEQNQARLAAVREELATSDDDKAAWSQRATVAERQVEEMKREREAAAIVATQLQEEQQMAAVRLSEQNQARLAAVREELATSDDDKAAWSQRATVAERQVEEMKREREAAAIAATQLQEEQQMAAVRLSEQNQARLAAVREELATSDDEKAVWSQRATIAERQVEEMKRTEGERGAIAVSKIERLEKELDASALREGHLRAELDEMRTAEETGQRETSMFNADVNETSATSSKVQQHRLAGYEKMATHTKPLVEGVQAWSDKSVIITIDNCGNCYQSSWFLVTILWAVQRPKRLRELIIKLLRGFAQDGALVHVPPHYQRYVEAVFLFLITTQKCWGYHASFPENVDGDDDFGIKQAVRIVEILRDVRGLATGTVEGGCNEDSLGLQLKRGLAIVARAFDVSWANRNGFPNMDIVATLHQSMEFDVGLQLTLMKSARDAVGDAHHPPSTLPPYVPQDIMRPACSLGYIVGMAMEDMGNNGHANRTDLTDTYASIATEAAEAQGRPNHTSIAGMLVWKASCPHYNVHVQSGALANALASTFGLDLSEGDAVASAELREGSRWQRENAMGIGGAIDPDELELLMAEARKAEAAASNPQDSSAAAGAAPASSPASLAAANRNDVQRSLPGTNGGVHASSEPWKTNERRRKKKKKK